MTNRRTFLQTGAASAVAALLPVRRRFQAALDRAGDGEGARPDYLLDPEITYLNHASIGTMPRAVMEALRGYLTVCEQNPWLYMWGGVWEEPREAVRGLCAKYLGCESSDVVFHHNTTETFCLLAAGLPLGAGDEVLFSSLNHVGASEAFRVQSQRRGYRVRQFDFPLAAVPSITEADVLERYDRAIGPNTRLLVLPHVDNTVGLRHPVTEIARLARQRGVPFVAVDAAQTVGMLDFDVRDLGVDAFTTSAHKWLQAPKGLGLAYLSPAAQQAITPVFATWGQARYRHARRFEDYGTRNLAELSALGDAVSWQSRLTRIEREQGLHALWRHMEGVFGRDNRFEWRSPRDWSLGASLVSVAVRGVPAATVFRHLYQEHGFVFRAFSGEGREFVRLSPNLANREEDISHFAELAGGLVGQSH